MAGETKVCQLKFSKLAIVYRHHGFLFDSMVFLSLSGNGAVVKSFVVLVLGAIVILGFVSSYSFRERM